MYKTLSPHLSSANSEVKRAVQTVKHLWRKADVSNDTSAHALTLWSQVDMSTPQPQTLALFIVAKLFASINGSSGILFLTVTGQQESDMSRRKSNNTHLNNALSSSPPTEPCERLSSQQQEPVQQPPVQKPPTKPSCAQPDVGARLAAQRRLIVTN